MDITFNFGYTFRTHMLLDIDRFESAIKSTMKSGHNMPPEMLRDSIGCGPAHLRNPNWGAHPCCFDARVGISGGIALALGHVPVPL
jgi:hypothetical protein